MKKQLLLLIPLFCLTIAPAHAVIIFSDNFDTENGGNGALNYTGFSNWTTSNGTVDLIGNGYFDYLPGSGLYLDMDGSTNNAGKITSLVLSLLAGNYTLSYDLAGSPGPNVEQVDVTVDVGIANASHSLGQNTPLTTFNLDFTLLSTTDITLSFEGTGNDDGGMLLDNIVLSSKDSITVPDTGSTFALLGAALFGLTAIRRKALHK